MSNTEDNSKNKTSGLLVTIGIHALIVLLMFIIPGFVIDTPLGGGTGEIEVSLGSPDDAGGTDRSMTSEGSEAQTPPPPQNSGDQSLDQNVTTDDQSESKIAVDDKQKKNPAPKTNTTDQKNTTKSETTKPQPKSDPNSEYNPKKGGTKNPTDGGDPNSTGYNGPGKGDKGKPNGDPTVLNPDGTGGNKSGTYKPGIVMQGRSVKSAPTIDDVFEQEGVLKFKITVDRDGNVIDIKKMNPPSTIDNYSQIEKAKKLIREMLKFNVKLDADEEQIGYYTIVYKKH